MTATRFYDELLAQVSNWPTVRKEQEHETRPPRGSNRTWEAYRAYTQALTSPMCKRLLFDSRQAVVFGELAEPPPEKAQHILHAPFDDFYLELTEPILFGEADGGHVDYIRAFLWSESSMRGVVKGSDIPLDLATLTVFKTNTETGILEFADSTFKLHLPTGMPFVSAAAATADPDPSEVGVVKPDQFFLAGGPLSMDNRHIGWWERLTIQYTQLWSWMMLYCMAKGIYIEQERLSRQQRRWLEAHQKEPQPWHLVKVEPKFTRQGEPSEGFHHSYRYDVIGHLRFANVRIVEKVNDDGTKVYGHKEMVEWVSPHQRGLSNTLYIPKTYSIESGKAIHPRFRAAVGP